MEGSIDNRKALFLDRDGTLIVDKDYLSDPAGVELLPGVAKALRRAMDLGYHLFLFTNQSGVGRGYFTLDKVHACNRRMEALLDLPEPGFVEIKIATETPDQPHVYRKPSPRFILEMIEKYTLDPRHCFMVGDRWSDVQAGLNANIAAIGMDDGSTSLRKKAKVSKDKRVKLFKSVPDFVKKELQ